MASNAGRKGRCIRGIAKQIGVTQECSRPRNANRYTSSSLALIPGARLGVYEVLAEIGEGGMGQMYRARDTKLHGDVALKSSLTRLRTILAGLRGSPAKSKRSRP